MGQSAHFNYWPRGSWISTHTRQGTNGFFWLSRNIVDSTFLPPWFLYEQRLQAPRPTKNRSREASSRSGHRAASEPLSQCNAGFSTTTNMYQQLESPEWKLSKKYIQLAIWNWPIALSTCLSKIQSQPLFRSSHRVPMIGFRLTISWHVEKHVDNYTS